MEFFQFKPSSTVTIGPPGGTGTPHHGHHGHHGGPEHHLPLPHGPWPQPEARFLHSTHAGHTALWVVFTLFTLGVIGVFVLSARVQRKARVFHWLSAMVLTIAMVSYFAMATGLGISWIPTKVSGSNPENLHLFRQVYVARYVDWLFTTPLLLVSLGVLAGLSPASTLLAIFADILMVVTGLFAGIKGSAYNQGEKYKWGWYTISCIAFLAIWYILIVGGRAATKNRGGKTRGLFWLLNSMTLVLWTAYPIVWALSEGTNIIPVNTEIIAYGVLDVAAKLGFTFILLFLHNHGEDDGYLFPEWFITPRGGLGGDGRGGYGAVNENDD